MPKKGPFSEGRFQGDAQEGALQPEGPSGRCPRRGPSLKGLQGDAASHRRDAQEGRCMGIALAEGAPGEPALPFLRLKKGGAGSPGRGTGQAEESSAFRTNRPEDDVQEGTLQGDAQ